MGVDALLFFVGVGPPGSMVARLFDTFFSWLVEDLKERLLASLSKRFQSVSMF